MQQPAFWQGNGPLARGLAPLGWLYDLGGVLRQRFVRAQAAAAPVICVGNATVGGTGKTPVAIDIATHLTRQGQAPHVLTRGYGGANPAQPLRVEPERHGADEVGDEALLLARVAPTWVSRDRVAAARAAVAAGASVLVMDDGFQNPALAKDLSLLVVDGGTGFGNGQILPAGPLRERPERALARSHAVVIVGEDRCGLAERFSGSRPVLMVRMEPDSASRDLQGRRVLAFAGIGRPGKFFETLERLGAEVVERMPFADHHRFAEAELRDLLARAERLDAIPATTEKDAARLPAWARERVRTVRVELVWDDPGQLETLLAGALGHGQG